MVVKQSSSSSPSLRSSALNDDASKQLHHSACFSRVHLARLHSQPCLPHPRMLRWWWRRRRLGGGAAVSIAPRSKSVLCSPLVRAGSLLARAGRTRDDRGACSTESALRASWNSEERQLRPGCRMRILFRST